MHVQSCPFVFEMQGGIHFLHLIKKCQNKAKQARIMAGQNICLNSFLQLVWLDPIKSNLKRCILSGKAKYSPLCQKVVCFF